MAKNNGMSAAQMKYLKNKIWRDAIECAKQSIMDEYCEAICSQAVVFVLGIAIKVLKSYDWSTEDLEMFSADFMKEYNEGDESLDVILERIKKETGLDFRVEENKG